MYLLSIRTRASKGHVSPCCMHVYTSLYVSIMCCMHASMRTCMCIYIHSCQYIHARMHVRTHTHAPKHMVRSTFELHGERSVYIAPRSCLHTYARKLAYLLTHARTHAHTHTLVRATWALAQGTTGRQRWIRFDMHLWLLAADCAAGKCRHGAGAGGAARPLPRQVCSSSLQ